MIRQHTPGFSKFPVDLAEGIYKSTLYIQFCDKRLQYYFDLPS